MQNNMNALKLIAWNAKLVAKRNQNEKVKADFPPNATKICIGESALLFICRIP